MLKKKNKTKKTQQKLITAAEIFEQEDDETVSKTKKITKTESLAAAANEITKELIPEGSSLDRELDYLARQWNKMISKEAYRNLTDDVNSLIRDYTRRVVKTLSGTSFTKERVEHLAKTLVNTPNMKKIKEEKALTEYVILYILRLVSNFQ